MSNSSLVQITSAAKFADLASLVKHHASFVHGKFWSMVKADQHLDGVHFSYANSDEASVESEASARELHEALIACCYQYLSVDMTQEILQTNRDNVLHWEVAQASVLEPHEEAAQWALWEKLDAQHEQDCMMQMYQNEY